MLDTTNERTITLYLNRAQLVRDTVPSLLKSVALWTLSMLIYRQSKWRFLKGISLFAGSSALAKGGLLLLSVPDMFVPRPLLVIDDKGITYNPPSRGIKLDMSITWEEIASLSIGEFTRPQPSSDQQKVMGSPLLFIVPKDVDAFRQKHHLQDLKTFRQGRNLLEIDLRSLLPAAFLELTGTPFIVLQQLFTVPFEDLLIRIRHEFADKLATYDIRIEAKQSLPFLEMG